MSRDTDFKEQSPESYAAMEKRLRHLRQRMTEFFASRKIFDVANKIDSLPTSARVVATMRSMANMAPGKARELVTSLTTIFRKGVTAIVETPAIRQTPETTQEPEIPALTHQKPDDSFTGIDLAARSDLAKKEFVPR